MAGVKCLVCGKDMKRVTHRHVKLHSMTWSEYERLRNNATVSKADLKPSEVLSSLSELLTLGDQKADQETSLQEVRRRWDDKVQYLKSILSTYDVGRVNRLLKFLEKVEARLFDPTVLATADIAELARVSQNVAMEVQMILTRLDKASGESSGDFGKLPSPVAPVQVNVQQNLNLSLPSDSFERERVRKALESLFSKLPSLPEDSSK